MMDVVAKHKGKYGKIRNPGDAFTLDSAKQFSRRWMVKAGTAEAKALVQAAQQGEMSPAQIAAEAVAATGKGADKALLAEKDARIAELEAEVAALRADDAPQQAEPQDEPQQAEPQAEPQDEPQQAGDAPARKSRRRTR